MELGIVDETETTQWWQLSNKLPGGRGGRAYEFPVNDVTVADNNNRKNESPGRERLETRVLSYRPSNQREGHLESFGIML